MKLNINWLISNLIKIEMCTYHWAKVLDKSFQEPTGWHFFLIHKWLIWRNLNTKKKKKKKSLYILYDLFQLTFNLPKHIPQSPCKIVSIITNPISPLHSTPNTTIMNMSTSAVCPHMTTNCVITWENNISNGVTPARKIHGFSLFIILLLYI